MINQIITICKHTVGFKLMMHRNQTKDINTEKEARFLTNNKKMLVMVKQIEILFTEIAQIIPHTFLFTSNLRIYDHCQRQ